MDLFLVDEVRLADYATVGFTTVRKHDFFFHINWNCLI